MNNNAIAHSSANNRHVAQSVDQKNEERYKRKEDKETMSAPQAQPLQINNRSYYYDSTGGGYKGL